MPIAAKSKLDGILHEITTLSGRQLDRLVPEVVALRLEKRRLSLPKRESELLKTINRGISPSKRRAYQALRQKLEANSLTGSERAQLLRISDELEWLGVRRLEALTELASLRKIPILRLIRQLGITPAAYAAAA